MLGHGQNHPAPFPHPPGPAGTNLPLPPTVPGLGSEHSISSQQSFQYNTVIPGLSFATPSVAPPTAPNTSTTIPNNHPARKAQPDRISHPSNNARSGPQSLARNSYQLPYSHPQESDRAPVISHSQHTPRHPASDAMEEGELDESRFEDLYEPYIQSPKRASASSVSKQHQIPDDEEYDPAQLERPDPPIDVPSLPVSGESAMAARERSRSYSPFLSLKELSTTSPSSQQNEAGDGLPESLSRPTISTPPLGHLSEVRFQDYLDEGIDAKIVRDLFSGLGLDTKTNKAPAEPPTAAKSHDIQPSAIDDHAPSVPKPIPVVVAPASTSKPPVTATSQKQEERKDRIARLLAAKNAKQQDLSSSSRPAATSNDTTASSTTRTSPQQAGQQDASEISRDKAAKKTEKERLLQLKLEALQKSRALRAQKARVSKLVTGASFKLYPWPVSFGHRVKSSAEASYSIRLERKLDSTPFKRAFNQHNVEKPLVIDVSDDSDDEDVEMEIGSQADDLPPESNHPNNQHQGRLSHLRDRPLPADMLNQHGLASPASGSEYAGPPRQADSVELQRINQHIDEMKRKIAEAERRKRAKAAPKDPAAQSQTPPEGSQVARIEREVDDMLAEKAKLASELASLTEGNTWAEDASLAPKDASSSSSGQPSPQYATQIFDADNDAAPPGLKQSSHTSANIESAPFTGTLVLSKSSNAGRAYRWSSRSFDNTLPTITPRTKPRGVPIENAGQQAQGPGASDIEEHTTQVTALHAPKQTQPLPAKPGMQEAVPLSVSTHISNAAAHSNEESPEPTTEIHIAPSRLTTPGFVPYQSVLKEFLSYRFHPNFDQDVSQGLRSLTYSNKINSTLPFCLDSLSPEGCHKGAACEFQHADAIDIPDSQILLQLGNSEKLEGKEQERYIDGLRALLSEFKAKQSKDFNVISKAIVDYRAQFYADQSRVLPLGNIKL
ncbi:unnamed protein product [Parascedosporium putredinis]|uniref:C3H1-type domain-containing protein n=1 Tax=Parascedosporium putredinis TaxID=1442378 RepID=A0A9P1GW48_9PEZI|nr:unnamed protein product [Parascedosporium putredinis]CAI7988115.1 unnamed protein product [Parascedosporium putredinis]